MVRLSLALAAAVASVSAQAAPAVDTDCGGALESNVWSLWQDKVGPLLHKAFVEDELLTKGNTYALYDLQGYLQNLVAMAARCGRTDRLRDMATWLQPSFDGLSDLPGGQGWVCKGGKVCSAANHLLGTEVLLYSSQYMALLTRIAAALAPVAAPGTPEDAFVDKVGVLALAHLNRWSMEPDPLHIDERLSASAASVTDGSSRLLFNDTDLWVMAIHAELAGIAERRPALAQKLRSDAPAAQRRMRSLTGLLKLLQARTTVSTVDGGALGRVQVAEIDRGFWRLYGENRYARYVGAEPPVNCALAPSARAAAAAPPRPSDTAGWDFSHSRRLVHALDALTRQRDAMRRVYDVPANLLPTSDLVQQYANQLAARIWTGDRNWPKFNNYWDGSPGWYRAGYDGSGKCFEGYPPGGMSDSFVTGGYLAWRQQVPLLGELGQRLYAVSNEKGAPNDDFLKRYYPGLADGAPNSSRVLTQLMFWSSLVAPTAKP